MATDVAPNNQNISEVFSNTPYYIDFYQRQYKWNEEPVSRLLEDVFYKFNIEYLKHQSSPLELDELCEKYSWYYLNTYVTNVISGKKFIVDGQQRLTTLMLILMKLRHLSLFHHSTLEGWISEKIAGQTGFKKEFWMNHEAHKATMKALFDKDSNGDQIDVSSGITARNMVTNYKVISKSLELELVDKRKFESFVFYFLRRLVLINLNVEQTEVPMVFEVINDRGVRLRPHEILKGKLLGIIDKDELEQLKLNELWESRIAEINRFGEDEIDTFFGYYLRALFANTAGESKKFDKDYHRTMFLPEVNGVLNLLHDPIAVRRFLQKDFTYYTELFVRISEYARNQSAGFQHVYFNRLNEMNSQFLLIISACSLNDPDEARKIQVVSSNVDKMFSLLSLQRSNDSNEFNLAIYLISAEIRKQDVDTIQLVFDKYLLALLADIRGVQSNDVFSYGLFKETGIELPKRFKRYFFSRVESFLAEQTAMNMKHSFSDLVANTGAVNGFHIEHILAENDENRSLFGNDLELFERERNRLGGLLLLKGKDNIASSNEVYSEKLKSYANSLYWNETLRADSYNNKLDFTRMIQQFALNFRPMDQFGPSELEERHRLLFDIARAIWL